MSSNQTSISSNLTNAEELIDRVSSFGPKYNPVPVAFTIPSLTELKASADSLASIAKTAENIWKNSTSSRSLVFDAADGLVTRAYSSYCISGAPEQSIQQAESKVRTYRNIRVSEKPTDEEIAAAKAEGKELRINVQHNATFDKKVENFGDIIDFLNNSGHYGPNETDISIAGLTAKHEEMKSNNKICSQNTIELDNARMLRDTVMFSKGTGLVDVSLGVKKYVKSAFGATSVQYKSISGLKFKNIKKINNPVQGEPQ
jgi:hypothetical protein